MARRFTLIRVVATSFLLCGQAQAGPPSTSEMADALFGKAKPLMDAGDFVNACPLFAQSYALDPQVGPILNLAACYEAEGRTASAWSFWEKGFDLAQARGQAKRAAFARFRAEELEPRLLRVTITVTAQAAEERIALSLDHAPLARDQWGVALPADPGEHTLEASGPGMRPWSSRFVVAPSHVPAVIVPVLESALAAPMAAPPKPERNPTALISISWTTAGLGLAALGVGAGFGGAAISAKNESTENRNCVSNDCNPTGASALARARQDAQIADVSFAIGAGALVTAAALWLVARTQATQTTRTAGVIVQPTLGQGSGSLSVHGAW